MHSFKLLLDKADLRNTFGHSVTRKTFAHDAFPTRHKTGAFCVPGDGGIHGPAGITRAEKSFTRMKRLFHLGNGAWCRLAGSLVISVGLVAGTTPALCAGLSSHAYAPLLSAGGAGDSSTPLVSDDGRFVVFVSGAENLTANDGNHFLDVFLRDRVSQITSLLSTNDAGVSSRLGNSGAPSISADGNSIAYELAERGLGQTSFDTVLQVTNAAGFLVNRAAGSRRSIGIVDGAPVPQYYGNPPQTNWVTYSNPTATDLKLTDDGKLLLFRIPNVPFQSHVPGSSQPEMVAAINLDSGTTNLLCNPLFPDIAPNGEIKGIRLSADGNRLAFYSSANNLNPMQTVDGRQAVYVYDHTANSNILVSVSVDGTGAAYQNSDSPDMSADGRYVVFASTATNLVMADTDLNSDIFLRDVQAGTTTLVSSNLDGITTTHSGNSTAPAISRDGRWIAFFSDTSDLVPNDPNGATGDVFLRDNQTGVVTLISNGPDWHGRLVTGAQPPKISADGSLVLYQAPGSGLFLYDRAAGTSRLLTDDVTADSPSMSSDGRFVAFSSQRVPGSAGASDVHRQIYLYDRELDSFELISARDRSLPDVAANDGSRMEAGVVATADDLLLARSYATDLGPGVTDRKLRMWDLSTLSIPLETDLGSIDGSPVEVAKVVNLTASADGRWLVFDYDEPALASSQTNSGWRVVLHDRFDGGNRVLNHSTNEVDGPHFPAIAPDASRVVWRPAEGGMTIYEQADTNSVTLDSGTFAGGSAATEAPVFSPDSRYVFFRQRGYLAGLSTDGIPYIRLIRLDTSNFSLTHVDAFDWSSNSVDVGRFRLSSNAGYAVYEALDSTNGSSVYVNALAANANAFVASNAFNPFVDNSGNWVVFDSTQPLGNLVDTNNTTDVFLKNRASGEVSLVSVNVDGTGAGNGRSTVLGISPGGRFVLFHSWASDLVANDTNQLGDLFLRDLRSQTTLLLTVGLDFGSGDGNTSARAMFNRDGTKIIFESYAANLVPGDFNETRDIYTATLSLPDSDYDGMPDSWELTYFGTLDRDGTGDYDGDGVSDLDEYLAGTNPTNNQSVLEVLTVRGNGSSQPEILWAAVPGRSYRVQYKDDFNVAGWSDLAGDVVANSSTGMRVDNSGTAGAKRFYRVLILP